MISPAGDDVTVQAVVGGVELAADEPLVERGVRLVEYQVPLGEPVQPPRLALPEPGRVPLGLPIQRGVGDLRMLPEPRGRLETLLLGEILQHLVHVVAHNRLLQLVLTPT